MIRRLTGFLVIGAFVPQIVSSNDGDYGVDVSFPIHHFELAPESWRASFYEEYMQGCRDFYNAKQEGLGKHCDATEVERIEHSLAQPREMVNMTETGFKKIRAPKALFDPIQKFWEANKDNDTPEVFAQGDTTVNQWETNITFVNIKHSTNPFGGVEVEELIAEEAERIISEWTGVQLRHTSLYGIRTYKEGAVLVPHADRIPLICSAIINVDQDVDEPWPLEVYDRQGKAVNITMEPGDMVLYESHSLIHGRPFPLKGRYFANIFIHFEPIKDVIDYAQTDLEPDEILPFYILPNTASATSWLEDYSGERIDIFDVAKRGRVDKMRKARDYWYGTIDYDPLISETEEGWQPIHVAAFAGQTEAVAFLLDEDVPVNTLTYYEGQSALFLAESNFGQDHECVKLLKSMGGESIDGYPDEEMEDPAEEEL